MGGASGRCNHTRSISDASGKAGDMRLVWVASHLSAAIRAFLRKVWMTGSGTM